MNTLDISITMPNNCTMDVGPGLFRPGNDTLALAEFASLNGVRHLVDLGCGCGTFPILLCPRYPKLNVTGIELDPTAAQYAANNITNNHLENRVRILSGDLRQPLLPAACADAVISNPPYFADGSGTTPSARQRIARNDATCSCEELVAAAARLLQSGGAFYVVWRPERLVDMFYALREAHLEPKRIQAARGKSLRFVLIKAIRSGKPGLLWEPELVLP